jgi:hypothetical protein
MKLEYELHGMVSTTLGAKDMMKTTALLTVSLGILIGVAQASWVDFDPIEASSPDGALRVSARFHGVTEWKNTRKTVPANGSMRYEMVDANSNSLWVADVPIDAGFSSFRTPSEIFISTNAWTTARTHSSELLCFSPEGKLTANLDILDTLIPDRHADTRDLYISSTAGRLWGQWYAHYYFFTHDGADHFVIRAYWDDRLVVRLSEGKAVTPDETFSAAMLAAEATFVTKTLEAMVEQPELDREEARHVITAVHLAGRSKMQDAVSLLQKVEPIDYSRGARSRWLDYRPEDGAIDPGCHSDNALRQLIHLALRRMGHAPRVFPCTRLQVEGTEPIQWAVLPILQAPREQGTTSLKPGLSPEEVVGLIGGPDFVFLHDDSWEYDMDTLSPYTLVLTWGPKGVKTITQTRPPMWQRENERDLQILER